MNYTIYVVASIFFIFYNIFIFKIRIPKRFFNITLAILFVCLVLLAYNYIPISTNDLYRYYQMLDNTRDWSWLQYQTSFIYRDTPLTSLYFYIMKGLENRSLFAAIPMFIIVVLISIALYFFNKKKTLNPRASILFIVSTISFATIIGIVSGVRQNVAWAFLMTAVYYDFFVKNKIILSDIILYTIPLLIHLSTATIIALRILFIFVQKFRKLNYMILLWPLFISFIQNFSYLLPLQFQLSLGRLELYVVDNSWTLRQIIALLGYLLLVGIVLKIKRYNKYRFINKLYLDFYLLILLFGLGSIFAPTLFTRFFGFILYVSLPIFGEIVDRNDNVNYIFSVILLTLQLFIFVRIDFLSGIFLN